MEEKPLTPREQLALYGGAYAQLLSTGHLTLGVALEMLTLKAIEFGFGERSIWLAHNELAQARAQLAEERARYEADNEG